MSTASDSASEENSNTYIKTPKDKHGRSFSCEMDKLPVFAIADRNPLKDTMRESFGKTRTFEGIY